ncbi:hypothetical protein GPECTOR_46g273 [Gonium pectorale]|uniref:Uncharacterized protein n=1 Tax=Gonium pectorale TaxID=33097 RepID=A0A150G8P3_GONPE|nr:hypothetical protein GPECTOR_46g273 [Gonium pectorale]|eukprot:KXZ46204.1 hypothetical protein GPECTOR_46g273 [Gonium pectorale]
MSHPPTPSPAVSSLGTSSGPSAPETPLPRPDAGVPGVGSGPVSADGAPVGAAGPSGKPTATGGDPLPPPQQGPAAGSRAGHPHMLPWELQAALERLQLEVKANEEAKRQHLAAAQEKEEAKRKDLAAAQEKEEAKRKHLAAAQQAEEDTQKLKEEIASLMTQARQEEPEPDTEA